MGGTGFVGLAVVNAAEQAGYEVVVVAAPRLFARPEHHPADLLEAARLPAARLASALRAVDVVVNAAGLATPGAVASPTLTGANALLPAVVVLAAGAAGATCVIHVSSAAVQGEREVLDASADVHPMSAYAVSKAAGEAVVVLARASVSCDVVIARATSVQGQGRATTRSLRAFARSPFASVAGSGQDPVPVTSDAGLARWIVSLGQAAVPPNLALQPAEGWTTASLLRSLSGREPLHLPVPLARGLIRIGYALSGLLGGRGRAMVRRVELIWFGQRQA